MLKRSLMSRVKKGYDWPAPGHIGVNAVHVGGSGAGRDLT